MPATLDISCPKCGKQLKVPVEYEGKKLKCKDCQEIFPVTARKAPAKAAAKPAAKGSPAKGPVPKAAAKAPPPPPPKEEPKKSPFADEDDDDDIPGKAPRAMGVIQEEDVPRCPHCAKELDPPDAAVCKNCGFNNITRVKFETKKVIASDATDWITHLAPGIIALIIVIGLIVTDIICAVNMRSWMEGGDLESEEVDLTGRKKMFVHPGAFIAAIVAASIFIIVPAGRFVIRRLILNVKPEEKVKK